ncbi:hypothetical protein J6N69_02305 [bacterium]|nr:hypothetical protein [bacterium]
MAVDAVNSYNNNNTCLVPMAKGAAVGAAIGWALKYGYPLNNDEKTTKEYIHSMNEIKRNKESFSPWTRSYIDEINLKKEKSLAEDVFVSTYDGLKTGEKIGKDRILKAFRIINEKNPESAPELSRLFHDAKFQAEKIAKKAVDAYKLATKHFRPTGFFVVTGAVVGATVALLHDVMKTDVKN